jgi:hypothetical protein
VSPVVREKATITGRPRLATGTASAVGAIGDERRDARIDVAIW